VLVRLGVPPENGVRQAELRQGHHEVFGRTI